MWRERREEGEEGERWSRRERGGVCGKGMRIGEREERRGAGSDRARKGREGGNGEGEGVD